MQSVGWQFFLSVLIRCYYRKYFSHRNNNNEKKRKTYRPVAGQKHTLTQTGSNLVEYLNVWFGGLLLSIKKEVSGTFSFTWPVTALPVSYLRRLTLCTTLSTSPPGHPGLPAMTCIYVVGLLPVELNLFHFNFYFGPPKINSSNSKLSLLWLHNLEKRKRTMKI